jgi:hypothetical protein
MLLGHLEGILFRITRVLFLAILLFTISAVAQTARATEALNHLGEQATVCGRITVEFDAQTSHSNDSVRVIQLDGTESFSILTWFHDKSRVGDLPVEGNLCVKGLIRKHPPENLIIFEPCPKVGVCTYHRGRLNGGTQVVLQSSASWYVPQ